MRDIIVTLIVFGSLPFIFKRPYLGMVLWVWISVMNPHSQGWGFARTFPFAAIIAAATVFALIIYKEKKALPITPVTIMFIIFVAWMSVTSLFAIHPDEVYTQWQKVYKIMGMTLIVMLILKERKHIDLMIWTIVISIGYYGVKGGLFTIRSGGSERVWGPEGTFIGGNNEVALAFVMVIPLMYYLYEMVKTKWARYVLIGSMLLCALAALGSYSRGAVLAIAAMAVFLWIKSKKKLTLGLMMIIAAPLIVTFMPSKWFDRVDTINTYQEDGSAMGRINAWKMATNLAMARPTGGGFEIYDAQVFAQYAPDPNDIHAAHSIYFQVLGEHGFIGLFLYLLLGLLIWRTGSWIIRNAKGAPELEWASSLAKMTQVCLLGFAVGGAFLSLLYFDVPYYLMCAMVATRIVVAQELAVKSKRTPGAGRVISKIRLPRPIADASAGSKMAGLKPRGEQIK
ncbi:MAG: putative O-glycosylation ligase, exosortase A system-associated [Glaciimonas sp.]|nr:putative O-glycosylation ligase, exosortase A system-associated [Glaciimonas sp.]